MANLQLCLWSKLGTIGPASRWYNLEFHSINGGTGPVLKKGRPRAASAPGKEVLPLEDAGAVFSHVFFGAGSPLVVCFRAKRRRPRSMPIRFIAKQPEQC